MGRPGGRELLKGFPGRDAIKEALREVSGDVTVAGGMLSMSEKMFGRRIKK
jgi:hypothetical protein